MQTAAGHGIRGAVGVSDNLPEHLRQTRGALVQRGLHHRETGQDHTPGKMTSGGQEIDRGGCAAHNDQHGLWTEDRACSDQRCPAIRAQLSGLGIAV